MNYSTPLQVTSALPLLALALTGCSVPNFFTLEDGVYAVQRVSDCPGARYAYHNYRLQTCNAKWPNLQACKKIEKESEAGKRSCFERQQASLVNTPECSTIAHGGGRGMDSVYPAGCTFVSSGPDSAHFLRHPPLANLLSVAALKNVGDDVVGSAVLVGPKHLLTAGHVACNGNEQGEAVEWPPELESKKVVAAIFNDLRGKDFRVKSVENFADFRVKLVYCALNDRARGEETANFALDYAIFELVAGSISCHPSDGVPDDLDYDTRKECEKRLLDPNSKDKISISVLPKNFQIAPLPASHAAYHRSAGAFISVLGYTSNVYFPRGLIFSTDGRSISLPAEARIPTEINYNVQTAPGFSGGPILDALDNWIGIHTCSHARPCYAPESNYSGDKSKLLDFELGGGGVSMMAITMDLKKVFPKEWLSDMLPALFPPPFSGATHARQ